MAKERQIVSDEVAGGRQTADLTGAHALLKPGNEALGVLDGWTRQPPRAVTGPAASTAAVEMERNAATAQRNGEAQCRCPIVVQERDAWRGGVTHGARPQSLRSHRDCTSGFCQSLLWELVLTPVLVVPASVFISYASAPRHAWVERDGLHESNVMGFTVFRRAASHVKSSCSSGHRAVTAFRIIVAHV